MSRSVQTLRIPGLGTCSQCGFKGAVREYASGPAKTCFCKPCWDEFMRDECTVPDGPWSGQISAHWRSRTDLELEAKDGAPQAVGWN